MPYTSSQVIHPKVPLFKEETLWTNLPTERIFSKEIKKHFKEGNIKGKRKLDLEIIEFKMNATNNSILGTIKAEESNDW